VSSPQAPVAEQWPTMGERAPSNVRRSRGGDYRAGLPRCQGGGESHGPTSNGQQVPLMDGGMEGGSGGAERRQGRGTRGRLSSAGSDSWREGLERLYQRLRSRGMFAGRRRVAPRRDSGRGLAGDGRKGVSTGDVSRERPAPRRRPPARRDMGAATPLPRWSSTGLYGSSWRASQAVTTGEFRNHFHPIHRGPRDLPAQGAGGWGPPGWSA
jgi:hypothetical protein